MFRVIKQSNFVKYSSLWLILAFVLFCLTGCTVHFTKEISDRLNPAALYKAFDSKAVDLSVQSKCKTPPTVKIVNIETRTKDFETMLNPPIYGVINPKEMMDSIAVYLKNGFEQSGIKGIDDQSKKVIHIKMQDLKSTVGVWSFGSYCNLRLSIPETGFTKSYSDIDNALLGDTAAAYAIHRVTRQIIDDPEVQGYILCKNDRQ